jgi:integrase
MLPFLNYSFAPLWQDRQRKGPLRHGAVYPAEQTAKRDHRRAPISAERQSQHRARTKTGAQKPLFYSETKDKTADDPTNPKRPRAVKTRERVAAWVREIGINDPELQPNHAWRHTFKAVGFRCGMSEKMLDAIVGHAPALVGRGYGEPTRADKARELRKFPRYK